MPKPLEKTLVCVVIGITTSAQITNTAEVRKRGENLREKQLAWRNILQSRNEDPKSERRFKKCFKGR